MANFILAAFVVVVASSSASAQYTDRAGLSAAPAAETVHTQRRDRDGKVHDEVHQRPTQRDSYGNAATSNYDLAVDGAFSGQTILVVDLYRQPFQHATEALRQKGFSVVRYQQAPSPDKLAELLAKSNQFWLLASCDNTRYLGPAHHAVIKTFFDAGHGVYVWGDNDPCNADADALAKTLVGARVHGDLPGDQVVGMSKGRGLAGLVPNLLITTGLEYVYEGITVATVTPSQGMTPVVYGSAGNLVTAAYELDHKRLLVDGGYTRLDYKWDTAGTGRYVKNAAAWLANYERFGQKVVVSERLGNHGIPIAR